MIFEFKVRFVCFAPDVNQKAFSSKSVTPTTIPISHPQQKQCDLSEVEIEVFGSDQDEFYQEEESLPKKCVDSEDGTVLGNESLVLNIDVPKTKRVAGDQSNKQCPFKIMLVDPFSLRAQGLSNLLFEQKGVIDLDLTVCNNQKEAMQRIKDSTDGLYHAILLADYGLTMRQFVSDIQRVYELRQWVTKFCILRRDITTPFQAMKDCTTIDEVDYSLFLLIHYGLTVIKLL